MINKKTLKIVYHIQIVYILYVILYNNIHFGDFKCSTG